MAATAVTKTQLVRNAGTALTEVSLATMTGSEGFSLSSVGDCTKLFLYFENTSAPDQEITIDASDTFTSKGQGDLTLTLAQNTPQGVVLEASRFVNNDGTITGSWTTSATGMTGVCVAGLMPNL